MLSDFIESELVESGKNFNDPRIKKIKKDFNELRDKPKTKEIRRDLYEIKNKRNWKKTLLELEQNLPMLKTYYNYDDIEYKEIRDVGNLEPTRTRSASNSNYLGMNVKEIKIKLSQLKNILMLSDHISVM